MTDAPLGRLRTLVADDDEAILYVYREILGDGGGPHAALPNLEAKRSGRGSEAASLSGGARWSYDLTLCRQAEQAVQAVAAANREGRPFAVAFLDVHMPPGKDGVWAAEQIRAVDPDIGIVIVTGYSDISSQDIARRIPPPDKLFYVQKPFHPQELIQFALALSTKWVAEKLLRESHAELEARVESRTAELAEANAILKREIVERERVEEALRASEAKFRGFVETSPDLVFRLTKTGRIDYVSPRVEDLYGYQPEHLIGRHLKLTTPDEEMPRALEALKTILAGKPLKGFEINQKDKAGRIVPMEINAVPVYRGEEIVGLQGIMRDITERREAEEQIRASLRAKETLLREIHHRVKNNLQVINSLLRLQSRQIKDKRYADSLGESQDRIRSMALIHEALYESKDVASVDFRDYIRHLSMQLFRSHGTSTARIALDVDAESLLLGIDFAIPCGLIINELVSNCLKHAFPGDRRGEIKISFHAVDENEIALTVSDNGIGIPEDVDFRKTRSLGLHLVTMLAEDQLRGQIELDRASGTEFRITFGMQHP